MFSFLLKFAYRIIVLFGFLLTIQLGHGITSRYLSLAFAITIIIRKRKKLSEVIKCINIRYLRISFFLLLTCSLIVLLSPLRITINPNESFVFIHWSHFIYSFIYIVVFSLFCVVEFDSLKDFSYTWLLFIIAECFAIYLAIISDSVRLFFYQNSYIGDGRLEERIEIGSRIMGFGIYASDGSLTMSMGIMTLILMKIRNKINDLFFAILYIMIFSATMFIGRTGVLVEISLLLFYFLLSGKIKFFVWGIIGAYLTISFANYAFRKVGLEASEDLREWVLGAFSTNYQLSTLDTATGTGLQFNDYIFWGNAGMTRGSFDGYTYNSDSGYLKMITAIGIIGAFCYYLGMLLVFLSPRKIHTNIVSKYIGALIISSFLIEFKEPYMMKLRIPWFIFSIILIYKFNEFKESRNEKGKQPYFAAKKSI